MFNQKDVIVSHQYRDRDQVEMGKTSKHLLCFLLKGKHTCKVTRVGDREYTGNILAGDICIKPASHSGFWSWQEPDDSMLFWIEPSFLTRIAEANDFPHSQRVELIPILNSHDVKLQNLVALFKQELEAEYSGGKIYQESLRNLLGIHLLRDYCDFPVQTPEYRGGLPQYKLKKTIEYINDRLAEDISLADLAAQVKLSQSHFSALFRQSTGKSPYKFLVQYRVDRAQELLRNTNMAISDVAMEVGFYDQSHLSRHMKKICGVSPKKLRSEF